MTRHFGFLNDLKTMIKREDFDPAGKHKPDLMNALVHASDIGNTGRPFEIAKTWTLKILSEFF
jgi:hypothetical protein